MAEVLVVEDENDIATPLMLFLEMEGYKTRYAEDGEAGLRAIDISFPDVILMDVEMPKLTGPEMAYRLLIEDAGRERIPIIVLSGVYDLEKVASRIGTPYFLSKPFSLEELSALLKRALKERKIPQPDMSRKAA